MTILKIPKQIKYSDIQEKKSLSPSNYKSFEIERKNKKKLKYFLRDKISHNKGQEPGSISYVKNSDIAFIRNSCINNIDIICNKNKTLFLNPNHNFKNKVNDGDILLCRDANIGEVCIFLNEENDNKKYVYSSGIVKLNFKSDEYKYYCLAMMKDSYFINQLDALTPKGSTIRHSGDLFLECSIPFLDQGEEWAYELFGNIVKNICYSEFYCNKKLRESENIIDRELMTKKYVYNNPAFIDINKEKRLDAGIYSEKVFQWKSNVKNYKNGCKSIEELGFDLKRGPNLAKRDLGRSIKTDVWKKNFNILVYPSDISDSGYIDKHVYLGARNKIWFLENKNILFSAEGTVGKTFIICDEKMKFTTNFHGTIIYPKNNEVNIEIAIFIGLYLNYLKTKGILEKMSVGGNGGSFAIGYWDYIDVPNFDDKLIKEISELYNNECNLNPISFDKSLISKSGIFQLNLFRMKCNDMLKILIRDIKSGNLKSKEYYLNYKDI
ncbi:hypothetical protein QTG96_12485 [Clostridium perfringens]|nr:hypothetical protein [Clostridium perfringens]